MKLTCRLANFRVREGRTVKLENWATHVPALYHSKKHYRELLEEYRDEISELQERLYAHNRYALLLIFQGMDAAGKDGAMRMSFNRNQVSGGLARANRYLAGGVIFGSEVREERLAVHMLSRINMPPF